MNHLPVPKEESISSLIYIIHGEKVMLDYDLATLYAVETRALKQSVRRNINRFPKDFMFQLTSSEWKEVITNCDNLGAVKFSRTMLESHRDILRKLEQLEKKDLELDEKVTLIFEYLKELEQSKQEEANFNQRKRIGFKTK